MHAIIRQGEGKYYVSAVFGYYKDITATDDYEKYLQNIYNAYYVVWDAEGKRLARCLAMVPDTKYILPDLPTIAAPNRLWREPSQIYIIPQVIIIDANQGNWRKDEEGVGCVVNILDCRVLGDGADSKRGAYADGKRELLEWTRKSAAMFSSSLRVNAVAPGPVMPPEGVHELAGETPLGRPTPEDVAAAVAFLLDAQRTSGCVVPVDGGQSL